MANTIDVKLKMSDDGSLRLTEKSAKKLGMSLDQAGISAQTADRQLKGAARTSANSTKNFSKMAQGISGGLVPAYATLAAQVFAVSAAFQFLTEAANFKNLIEGQQAFGQITGTTYKSLTMALQDATNGQLQYAEAAKAAAIGTAAGLNAGQLEELSAAATNVSLALGRDLTDSFNRLIRGVTKAEPELLDELGIVLRLDPALRNYAAALDKDVSALTAFERTQAVTNEVLEQAATKFGDMEAVMDPAAFAVAQFGKAFDDVVNSLKIGLATVAETVLPFFTNNISSLIAALTVFAVPIVKSILPSFDDMGERLDASIKKQSAALAQARKDYDATAAKAAQMALTQEQALKKAGERATGAFASAGVATPAASRTGRSGADFLLGRSDSKSAQANARKILDNAKKQIREHGEVVTGTLKGFNEDQVNDLRKSYIDRTRASRDFAKNQVTIMDRMTNKINQAFAKMQIGWSRALGRMSKIAKGFARGVSATMNAIAIIGALTLLIDLGKELFGFNKRAQETEERLAKINERFQETSERSKTLAEELQNINMQRLSDMTFSAEKRVIQLGNAAASVNLQNIATQIKQLQDIRRSGDKEILGSEGFKEQEAALSSLVGQLGLLDPAFKQLGDAVAGKIKIDEIDIGTMLKRQSVLQQQSQAVQQLAVTTRAYEQELQKFIGTAPRIPFLDLLEKQAPVIDNLQKKLQGLNRENEHSITKTRAMNIESLETQIERSNQGVKGAKLSKAELESKKKQLKVLKETQAIDEQTFKDTKIELSNQIGFRDALNKKQTDFLALNTHVLESSKMQTELSQLGNSFDEQRLKTTIPILKASDKLAKAKEAELTASALVEGLDENAKQSDRDRANLALERAQTNVENAEKELHHAARITVLENQRLDIAKRLSDLSKQKREDDLASLAIQLQLQNLQAGVTVAGVGTQGQQSAMRGLRRDDLQIKQRTLVQQLIDDAKASQQALNDETLNPKARDAILDKQNETAKQLTLTGQQIALLDQEAKGAINLQKIALKDLEIAGERFTFNTKELEIRNQIAAIEAAKGITFTDDEKQELEGILAQQMKLKSFQEEMIGLAKGMETAFANAFVSMADGSKSAKQAFGDMAKSILKMIIEMTIRMLIMQALTAAIGGGFSRGGTAPNLSASAEGSSIPGYSLAGGLPKGKTGGVFGPRGYQPGGISKGPESGYLVELHGVEAIVPLPDGKNIPAQLSGKIQTPAPIIDIQTDTNAITNSFNAALSTFKAESPMPVRPTVIPTPSAANGNGTNNVTVNVSMETGEATTTERKGPNMSELGKTVAAAVQAELQHQKRPGGILSPFGAS